MIRLRRFAIKPTGQKLSAIQNWLWRWRGKLLPGLPLPIRLPFGFWWLAWNDVNGRSVYTRTFEQREYRFTERFLKPGMFVLDIGAHHGFYTLLASKRVGFKGQIIAFEPSPRERKRLLWHLRLNRCRNVRVESTALGGSEAESDFFLVIGKETGCNSLRPPAVAEPTKVLRVKVVLLGSYLTQRNIERVDFIKMDVEGAELQVLEGAREFLCKPLRPVILCEVQDLRTQTWGYRARDIVVFLSGLGFHWFVPLPDGGLEPIASDQADFDGNFIAVPKERIEQLTSVFFKKQHSTRVVNFNPE
jgi:FkbM family methyltransferase